MAMISQEASTTVVFLPATRPGDTRFGRPPERVDGFPELGCATVPFERQVWYNRAVCDAAAAHIRALPGERLILVGFSKSAIGAWTLTSMLGSRVRGTVLFDGPVARDACPPWNTAAFYASDEQWQSDLPIRTINAFRRRLAPDHRLALIPGALFRDEMAALASALRDTGHAHLWIDEARFTHNWNSGWIEAALTALARRRTP